MGAAFDDQLIEDVATVIATEARAFNNANRTGLDFWTPNINPFRDPRWGRGQGEFDEQVFMRSADEVWKKLLEKIRTISRRMFML